MSAIRPDLPVFGQPAAPTGPVRDAQAAFFRAALGQAATPTGPAPPQAAPQTTARTAAPQAVVPQITPVTTRPAAEAPQPDQSLRPGSLVDIRI